MISEPMTPIFVNCKCGGKAVTKIKSLEHGMCGYDISDYKTYQHLPSEKQILLADLAIVELREYKFECLSCRKSVGENFQGVS